MKTRSFPADLAITCVPLLDCQHLAADRRRARARGAGDIANSRTDDLVASSGGDPAALPNALTEGYQSAFLGGAAIAALGLVLTLVLIRSRDSRAHVELGARAQEQPAEA